MNTHAPVNILLVDDQPSKLLSFEVILQELGESLIKASSAHEALEKLLKTDVAVVLIDVCMPDLDGFELAKMLRGHPRHEKTAIIFISAIHLTELDLVRGYESGGVDYVTVPVVPEVLRAKVKIFVELYRKTRQLEQLNRELERRVSERTADLEVSTERLRLASEAAGFGTYDYNAAIGEFYWSAHLRRMTGITEDEPLTLERTLELVHPDHRSKVREHMLSRNQTEDRPRDFEFKIVRPDGETRWLLDRGQMVRTDGVRGQRLIGTILDITERKLTEERQKLLMEELDHRVKNILENVNAIARLSSQRAESVDEFVKTLEGRIHAMSRAHGLLRRSGWGGTSLRDLVAESLAPFGQFGEGNVTIDGERVLIRPELTQPLTLILHELVTNAVKHGALSNQSGCISVSWSKSTPSPTGTYRLLWQESGGPAVMQPTRNGFGLTVLQSAAREIGAVPEFQFARGGFIYSLEGPFEASGDFVGASETATRAEGPDAATEPSESKTRGTGSRVLVVEDEIFVALQLQMDLENWGYSVVGPGRNLEEGTALARTEAIDAALIDVRLGDKTSGSIADILIEREIPFVFTTGYTDSGILPLHLRNVPRLAKPYATEVIRQTIEQLISNRARKRSVV